MDYDYYGNGPDNAAPNNNLLMKVDDVFSITGRGTVVTGKVLSGPIAIGDKIQVVSTSGSVVDAEVKGLEAFRRTMDVANTGDNVGLLISNVDRDQVERGASICRRG